MRKVDMVTALLTHELFVGECYMQWPCVFRIGQHFLKQARVAKPENMIWYHAHKHRRDTRVMKRKYAAKLSKKFPFRRRKDYGDSVVQLARRKTFILYAYDRVNSFYNSLAEELVYAYDADRYVVTAFASLGGVRGLKRHKDGYHVFSFQHTGKSRWRIYDRLRMRLLLDVVLEPGDVIYVPLGFYHEVERLTAEECHVSIGITYRNQIEAFEALYTNPVLQLALVPEERGLKDDDLWDAVFHHLHHPIQTTAR